MKNSLYLCIFALLLALASGNILAQDQDSEFHSALSDNFILAIGAFRSDSAFTVSSTRGREVDEDDIDFGDSIGVDESNTLFNAQLRWKFGKKRKWSLWGQYFENDATGDATLTKDVEWQGLIFREGTFVEGGVNIAIARLFLGYSIVKKPQHDFGVGAGLHNLDIGAFIGGEVRINDETSGYQRADVGASQPLPNLGAWYNFSPAKRWLLHGRVDWISADIDIYNATMWNFNAGVNFQAWRHVGFDLSYQYFEIDGGVDDGDWIGNVNMRYSGPIVSMTFTW